MPGHYDPFDLPRVATDNDFFMAVVKNGKDCHSSVIFGVMVDEEPVFLARVGKVCDKNPFEAELYKESFYPHDRLSYQAYAITHAQYVKFMLLLAKGDDAGEKPKKITYFHSQDKQHFEYQWAYSYKEDSEASYTISADEKRILDGCKTLHLFNTCRDSVVDIATYILDDKAVSDRISRLYFLPFLVSANFVDGKTVDYFYVFPMPPSTYCEANETLKYKRLMVIYKRMEQLLTKEPQHPHTKQKFDALKKLYTEQAGLQDARLDVALQSILQWQEDNRHVVSDLRNPSFFSRCFGLKSSTETMTESLVQELEEQLAECPSLT